jgi:hypothetical protein
LLVVRRLINECPDRGSYREKESTTMTTFTIDNDNNITGHANAAEAKALTGTERFGSESALAKLASNWTVARLVEIHNTLTGVTPVKKFKDRNAGAARIWTAIQSLGEPAATGDTQDAERQPESNEEAQIAETAPAAEPEPTLEQPATIPTNAPQTPADAPEEVPAKKKTTRAKKAPVATQAAESKGVRAGSKTETVLALMKQPGGTTLKAIMPYASHCTSLA